MLSHMQHIDGTLSTTAETKKSFRQVMKEVGKSTWSRSMCVHVYVLEVVGNDRCLM